MHYCCVYIVSIRGFPVSSYECLKKWDCVTYQQAKAPTVKNLVSVCGSQNERKWDVQLVYSFKETILTKQHHGWSASTHLNFMPLTTHIESNEVSIKIISGSSDNVSAFRSKLDCLAFSCFCL